MGEQQAELATSPGCMGEQQAELATSPVINIEYRVLFNFEIVYSHHSVVYLYDGVLFPAEQNLWCGYKI